MHITHLTLLTANLSGTENFYNEVLGLAVIAQDKESIVMKAGATEITFAAVSGIKPVYHFAFNIPHNKLDEAMAWLENRADILVVEHGSKVADFVNWNAKSFYFYDNNGNVLELIARYDLDNASELAFDGRSILCVSEIGVVTEEVTALGDRLMLDYGLPVFIKQPRLNNFAAFGDDSGLIILSSADRNWYPTHTPAQKFDAVVCFDSKVVKL